MSKLAKLSQIVQFEYHGLRKIISGGQVGADRGGLEAAKKFSFPTGGWAPAGWRTDKGSDPSLKELGLLEHSSSAYPPRTKLNVIESDATLIVASNPGSPGCWLTQKLCTANKKPVFILRPVFTNEEHLKLVDWVISNQVEILNVAGNRDKAGQIIPDLHHITADQAVSWLLYELDKRQLLNRCST